MEMQGGVIVATGKVEASEKIKSILIEGGYDVLGVCKAGNELIMKTIQCSPELVILSYKLPDTTVMEVYDALVGVCDFLVLTNESYLSIVSENMDVYYLPHPFSRSVLLNSVSMIFQGRKQMAKLQKKVKNLENKMEERKLIEKAKKILIKNKGITENEAFKFKKKKSMNTGEKMIKIAKDIISKQE